MSRILFKNLHLIDPALGLDARKDVLIVDGVIERIDDMIASDAETIDMRGKYAAPGFCDMHVHLREPGYEYKEDIISGAAAAAAGGFTAVACMPNTNPAIDSAETVMRIKKRAEGLAVDVYPIAAVSRNRAGKELSPMAELYQAGAVAFSDDGAPVSDARLMRLAFEYAGMFQAPVIQHAEDLTLSEGGAINEGYISTLLGLPSIPRIAEDTMILRDIAIAEYIDAPYHVAHISTVGSAIAVRQAKERGLRVTCEVAPHHFALTDEAVIGYDTNTKMNPPLRTMDDVLAMKEGLRDGIIDVIATDHAPHSLDEKDVEYVYAAFGIVGLETAVGLTLHEVVHQGFLSLPEMIEKLSTNPRRILRLPDIRIETGEKANLTFFDPNLEWKVDAAEFKSKSRNTPFHGWVLKGKPLGIYNNGTLVWNN